MPFGSHPQLLCSLHSVLVFTALSRRCQAAPQSRAAVLSLNHHILGNTKRPAITRNPARRARSACQVPPTVTSLFTINERFTLHQSLPLPIPSPAHIQARVVFSSSQRQLAFVLFCFFASNVLLELCRRRKVTWQLSDSVCKLLKSAFTAHKLSPRQPDTFPADRPCNVFLEEETWGERGSQ